MENSNEIEQAKKEPYQDYLVQRYCDMMIEVATECKSGKRDLTESIELMQKFGTNLESFKV